jgi:hypothetical protein
MIVTNGVREGGVVSVSMNNGDVVFDVKKGRGRPKKSNIKPYQKIEA